MASFLDSLGLGGRVEVYLSVTQSSGLELMLLDARGNVKSYAQTPLEYNEAQREIANYEQFKAAVEDLFKERHIDPKKANVHLNLPTVWFGHKEGIPLLLDESAISNIIIGELESSYIFKRKEPLPFWFDDLQSTNTDSRSVFYTALQVEAVNQIKDILTGMGAVLVGVTCSLFSSLKALYAGGIATSVMGEGSSWSLMIVNSSGYQMYGLVGQKIVEYYEEPLPLKSYEGEEIYSSVSNSAQIALMSTPSSALVVISETELLSAEILGNRLQFSGTVIPVDDNKFKKEPLVEMSLNILPEDQIKVSLPTIGFIAPDTAFPIVVDFLAATGQKAAHVEVIDIPIGNGKTIQLTPQKATVIAGIILALILGPVGIGHFMANNMCLKVQEESANLDAQITSIDEQIKAMENQGGSDFDPVAEIERVLKNNRIKIMAYAALGESVPKSLYLTYFMTGEDGMIDIKGCADSVEDVYVFFKNLKDSLVESKLRISKLDLKSGSLDKIVTSTISTVDDAPYVFEITNMDDSQLKSFMDKLFAPKDANNNNNQQQGQQQDPNAQQNQGEAPANGN